MNTTIPFYSLNQVCEQYITLPLSIVSTLFFIVDQYLSLRSNSDGRSTCVIQLIISILYYCERKFMKFIRWCTRRFTNTKVQDIINEEDCSTIADAERYVRRNLTFRWYNPRQVEIPLSQAPSHREISTDVGVGVST